MNTIQFAELLNINPRTARRYINKGLIYAKKTRRGQYEIDDDEINRFKIALEARKKLNHSIKELYVLSIYGAISQSILNEHGFDEYSVKGALCLYHFEREQYLKKFKLGELKSDILLIEEAASRLKISDMHVIYELGRIDELENRLDLYEIDFNGRLRFFPSIKSFGDYLGNDKNNRFYNSREVSEMINLSVNQIDRIALGQKIGRKIKEGYENSNYLFVKEDIEMILCR